MFRRFYPAEMAESSYDIDYEELYRKGYRGLIYDIDNTLVEHGADANAEVIELFRRLNKIGFRICLLSNNKAPRVRRFYRGARVKGVRLHYIFNAHKPARRNYLKAMVLMRTTKKNTLFIGDQIFTDVYGANRSGIRSILVKPINKAEEVQIVAKRKLERIILRFYRRDRWEKMNQLNVVLIGFAGAGKTSVGKVLAAEMGFDFIDTDRYIEEKVGMSIAEIFRTKGEEYFRDLETMALKGILKSRTHSVIAAGAGMPIRLKNQKMLRKLGTVVYLSGSEEEIIRRFSMRNPEEQPVLLSEKTDAERRELFLRWRFVYPTVAHRTVDIDDRTVEQVADAVRDAL
ncbi:MAG: YqeG family HAD IIIA-type phosphatase [Lachnospiraceae bacterium]|nr:YqeG family HAD IIIA-type phosphatase [Lachnospiraceae bacterium]MCR5087011.1 YqeG family HAD IIIA-type phosphatase [Lachnospiraceae bacterium]